MTAENWISIVSLFVELLKSIIPFGVIVWIFFYFQKEVKQLIKNGGLKITAPGVSLETINQQQIGKTAKEKKEIEQLTKELKDTREHADKLKQLQEYVIKDKDTLFLGYHFEKTYRIVFPSQMVILNILNNTSEGMMDALARAIFIRTIWAKQFSTTYEQFMGFLIQSGLVINTPQNTFLITPMGKLFMEYLTNNNIPLKLPATDTV